MKNKLFGFLCMALFMQVVASLIGGCAQISAPTGGSRDTTAPYLVKANPETNKLNFTGNKIILNFSEYIQLQDLQSNLLISPLQKNNPIISSNLKTITIKLKDSLLPNTTYSFNFGNSIKDINEGNVLKEFSYTFSTGNSIDSLQIKGKVIMAENGKVDSTLLILLYRNAHDTSVRTRKPDYITRLNGAGEFTFYHLPEDNFKVYALKDGDGNKWYNSKTETFAFNEESINTAKINAPTTLYAYIEKKQIIIPSTATKNEIDKKLRYTNNLIYSKQDLLQPLELIFNTALKNIKNDSIILYDTSYKPTLNSNVVLDSSRKKIIISAKWQPDMMFCLIIPKTALEDSAGLKLLKNDTLRFTTKTLSEYGSLKLTFKNMDLTKHPLLLFMDGDNIKWKYPLLSNEWTNKMILPGEYDIRLLYDENNNGQWDPGDYSTKLQPERAVAFPQKLSIKADWENEREIVL